MRTIRQLTDNKFLNIKEVQDKENGVSGYQFAERMGVDSVAFICFDKRSLSFLLNNEYKPPVNEMILGAFGGSLDKNKDLVDIVKEEVKEEAGFMVTKEDIRFLGKVLVSTQMNQFCHLYLVFVDRNKQGEREPENEVEERSKTEWHTWNEKIYAINDWKPITIISMAAAQDII
jgi:hypothetical protein